LTDVAQALNRPNLFDLKHQFLKRKFSCLCFRGVETAFDTSYTGKRIGNSDVYLTSDVISRCNSIGVEAETTYGPSLKKYMTGSYACKIIPKVRRFVFEEILNKLERHEPVDWVATNDVYQVFLRETKKSLRDIPFWPYADKDNYMPLSSSLAIEFDKQASDTYYTNPYAFHLISTANLRAMFSGEDGMGGDLFKRLNIVLKDGSTPSVGIYDLRKYHQTQALLSGISEVVADKLAGRNTGMQSAHYDKRTTGEIVNQSIDLFDPNEHYTASGPRVEDQPNSPVERQVFLYENSAPKQMTEVGGCVIDWAMNPCEQHGDCMRCGEAVWMKGDTKRLPNIQAMFDYNNRMRIKAEERIESGNDGRATTRLRDQYQDVVSRCLMIFEAEQDHSIPKGHIITFGKALSADGVSDLVEKLKWEH
jgi:hypothetical protein